MRSTPRRAPLCSVAIRLVTPPALAAAIFSLALVGPGASPAEAKSRAASASSSKSARPKLVKPANKGKARIDHIELVVKDTSALARKYGVFVSISRSRKTKRNGELKKTSNVSKGQSFVKLHRWAHHRGLWIYKPAKYDFPGYWATTPGRYFWQAQHTDCNLNGCEALSKIGSFREVK